MREHLVVDLRDQVILAVGVTAPDLAELDGLYRQDVSQAEAVSEYLARMAAVNCGHGSVVADFRISIPFWFADVAAFLAIAVTSFTTK